MYFIYILVTLLYTVLQSITTKEEGFYGKTNYGIQ